MAAAGGAAPGNMLVGVAGRTGWIISDGKAGHDVQSRGVFDALGLDYDIHVVNPTGVWRWLAPWAPVNPAERFGTAASPFRPPWPDFAISIGRLTTPYMRKLKQAAGLSTYAVILQDPRVAATTADLFWVPQHDKRRGPNVITTLTAPHSYTARRIAELRATMPSAIAKLPQPRVAVTIGGPNGDYPLYVECVAAAGLCAQIAGGAGCRVDDYDIAENARRGVGVRAGCNRGTGVLLLGWEGENPYPYFIAHADAFIAPANSVNMCGEPCATGRPVYVFHPEGGSAKFTRFHEALSRYGATRPLPERFERLETWSYAPLNSSEAIATEIARRWHKRRQMVGSPRDQALRDLPCKARSAAGKALAGMLKTQSEEQVMAVAQKAAAAGDKTRQAHMLIDGGWTESASGGSIQRGEPGQPADHRQHSARPGRGRR